jgi:mRNA-degrading endonuclease RelE of RelBE toxin-antitoxin system
MKHEIVLAPEARNDLRRLRARDRATVLDAIETYLRHTPGEPTGRRIKRLRGLSRPQYRLRVGDTRVFYDIVNDTVEVLAIVRKADADTWLREAGEDK